MHYDEGSRLNNLATGEEDSNKKLVILFYKPSSGLNVYSTIKQISSTASISTLLNLRIFGSFETALLQVSIKQNTLDESTERTQPRSPTSSISATHNAYISRTSTRKSFLTFADSAGIQPSYQRIILLICSSRGHSHGIYLPHADTFLITCTTSTIQNASHVCNHPW
jgi:hypothetical protein